MKRWISAMLTVCLVFSTWVGAAEPVYAATPEETGLVLWAGSDEIKAGEEVDQTGDDTWAKGILEVEVNASMLSPFKGKVTVHISNSDQTVDETKEMDFGENVFSSLAEFGVAEGDYTVTVSAAKFADYIQQVHVAGGYSSRIKVCAAKVETGSEAMPGWILPGDVNEDKAVDQKDIDALLTAVRKMPESVDYDLTGDEKTDLLDLQYAVQSMGENQESSVEKHGIIREVSAADGTVLEDQDGVYILKPADTTAEISEDNFVSMDFVLEDTDGEFIPEIQGMTIYAPFQSDEDGNISSEITDGEAVITYMDEDGEQMLTIPLASQPEPAAVDAVGLQAAVRSAAKAAIMSVEKAGADGRVSVEADGSLVLNFGTQIAVKRVTIKITGTKKTEPLVNIAKVEFVNNMEERIPAPQLDIPTLNAPIAGNESLTVSWTPQVNITGYEVYVSGPVKKQSGIETQIVRVSGTQHLISSINGNDLKNFAEYTIKVRSVNGDWSSPWSNVQTGIPQPQKLPDPPDNVVAKGGICSISVSWKDMDDANGYMVYYKKYTDPDSEYRPVVEGFTQVKEGTGKLSGTSYTIRELEEAVKYSVYVVGWNELGWGRNSLVSVAETLSIVPPVLPAYKLINTSNGKGNLTAHIADAVYGGHGGAKMVGSSLDTTAKSALGLVDDDYASYWVKNDWDDGVAYPANDRGMTVTLDQDYQMDYITFAAAEAQTALQTVRVRYWNTEDSAEHLAAGVRLLARTDKNKNTYYIIKFEQTINANKVHISLGRSSARADMMVGEIRFHEHDTLEDDITGLFVDDMHTTLRPDVTEADIDALEERLDTPEPVSGETHVFYDELKLELETAREILTTELAAARVVDNRITAAKDGHLGFGGLNAWQPLGKTVYAGEKLLVFVGHNTKKPGESASLQLVFTQYHAESNSVARTSAGLKVGRNEITVPQVAGKDVEQGGQLYVAYTGNNASDQYAVRISGGSDIPTLNVYGKTGEERTNAIKAYVEELESYVGAIEEEHGKHRAKGDAAVDYAYDRQNCILNATDIMMREMMYSLPATQIWAGISGAADTDARAAKLDQSLQAMEQAMTLFYQHKGLSDNAGTIRGNNAWPAQHLNIRYMRMFSGAFMYASGNHIGIEWGSAVLSGTTNMSGFGWGIAHEIGHDINQGSYAAAEVTNNYFAQLLTGKERYQQKNVYAKVTSGTTGKASNVFTQLAMYWQLHQAFDDNLEDRHIYDNYEDQFNNVFFARVDTYARNPSAALQAGLTLSGGSDQCLMRLSCAAANKNILPFFERWGMIPDAATIAYAEKYGEPETKALYYVNEDARKYRVANAEAEAEKTILNQDVITKASINSESNRVTIDIATDQDAELILGYEVKRSMISNGEKQTQIIGFIPIDTAESTVYTDTIASINNRVMEYEVTAVDKFLNYSNPKNAGSAKIQTDGVLDKSQWTVESTLISTADTIIEADEEDPDSGYNANNPSSVGAKKVNSIERILDNDRTEAGTFEGSSNGSSEVTVDMHKIESVTALKIYGTIPAVNVEISADGENWIAVKENCKDFANDTIWFDSVEEGERESWIGTYDARYLRLRFTESGDVSIQEIEICGPSGDNLEFMTAEDGKPAIGVLKTDYKYGTEDKDVIPAGSLIFTGTYKGNPAYNIVMLYDTEGNVIGAKDNEVYAGQVIFAQPPKNGNLGETSDGLWVYYVEKGHWDEETVKAISGVRGELFRVDNAETLAGERIVSDTLVIDIPETLPDITITDAYGSPAE